MDIADERNIAVGSFNASCLEAIEAELEAAEELNLPIIIQFAQCHEPWIPLTTIGPIMVEMAKKATVPVCVHLDHGETLDYLQTALQIGFTGIMYDGSLLAYEENLENTKKAVEMAGKYGASVEAELGSMGKRRIRLLSEHKDIELFGIDSQQNRCEEVKEKFGIKCYVSIADAVESEHPDAAVISTSPLSHAAIIKECLQSNLHVFTEINLVSDGYEENLKLAKEKGLTLFLSSTFLYQAETLKIIEKVKSANVSKLNYIYHVGQYLPDWHPWESYNNYFIGNPRTNGCREILTIDLPWIVTAFGDIKTVHVMKSKNTDLNIEYNDNYLIMLEH